MNADFTEKKSKKTCGSAFVSEDDSGVVMDPIQVFTFLDSIPFT